VVLVDDEVADPQIGEGGEPVAGGGGGRATAVHQPPVGDHRQLQVGGDEAVAERRLCKK
jgi:hypothetical protein